MTKRIAAFILALVYLAAVAGCGQKPSEPTTAAPVTQATEPTTQATEPTQTEPVETAPVLNYQVDSPMAMPDYSVPENYTTDDLRQIAVRAMRDLLTIQWTPARYYTYRNQYDWVNKQFQYVTGVTFSGVPYANGHMGIFQWFKYYDPATGVMDFPGSGQEWGETLGTVCADCILWAWSTVCNSYDAVTYTYHMTPGKNFVGTGTYMLPEGITSFKAQTTDMICEANGIQGMAKAYAALLPADALTSTSDVHAVMCIRPSTVVYLADGSIDVDNSFVHYQDQSGGTSTHFNEVEEDGVTRYYVGHTDAQMSFADAYSRGFIPITTKEFLGQKEYTPAQASYEGGTQSLRDLYTGMIKTNYPLCAAELVAEDEEGNRTRIALDVFTKKDSGETTGLEGYTYFLSGLLGMDLEAAVAAVPGAQKVILLAQVTTGDEFQVASFDVQ